MKYPGEYRVELSTAAGSSDSPSGSVTAPRLRLLPASRLSALLAALPQSAWGSDDPTRASFAFLHGNAFAEQRLSRPATRFLVYGVAGWTVDSLARFLEDVRSVLVLEPVEDA